jgi:hypothetical protein
VIPATSVSGAVSASGGSWSPGFLSSKTLWLDAASGITLNTGVVQTWIDKTASKIFTQATPERRPAYSASDANLNNQPSVIFSPSGSGLPVAVSTSIEMAYLAIVAYYPATTFSDFSTVIQANSPLNASMSRGNSGMSDWRTADMAATRYRDGVETSVALTSANSAHFYEIVPDTPIASTAASWLVGNNTDGGTREWRGGIGLIVACSSVPASWQRSQFLRYCQERFGTPTNV